MRGHSQLSAQLDVDTAESFEDFCFLHTSLCNACIVDVVAHSFLFGSFFNLKVLVTSGVYFGLFFLIFCGCHFFLFPSL